MSRTPTRLWLLVAASSCLALALGVTAGCDDGDGDGDADADGDADGDGDGDGDGDADGDADGDGDGDGDADGDGDGDGDGDADPACGPMDGCAHDSDCADDELCSGGQCERAVWPQDPGCVTDWERCVSGPFPDPCYAAGVSDECPQRPGGLRPPSCFSFLELGAPGAGDDALVLRLVHDLWARGRAAATPTRPKVVLAVGDSISESLAYVSSASAECRLPDFLNVDGYRLAGQSSTFDVEQTAMSGQTAEWGLSVLTGSDWYDQVRPEVATVMFGTNELWSWWEGLQEYVENMRAVVDALLAQNVIPILMTPPPGLYEMQRIRTICGTECTLATNYETEQFAQAIRDLAAERLLPLVDLHRRFADFDRPGWEALFIDEVDGRVHPCTPLYDVGCALPGGAEMRDDAVLRMYKWLEANAMTRCPGSTEPPAPAGYAWNDADVLANFRGAAPVDYCPDPYAVCE